MSKVQIRSACFPNVYLRIDGAGVTQPVATGGGIVNCQFGVGPRETLEIINHSDGTFSIASTVFPNVFLRLDGGGVVNCQYAAGSYEKFRFEPQADGSVAIASAQFPGVYLRMNGGAVSYFSESGGGTVYARFGVGSYDRFIIENAEQESSDDYLRYFFIRNKGANGLVLGFAPTGMVVAPRPMLVHQRGTQLFKCMPIARDGKFVQIINQSTQLALQACSNGSVQFAHANRTLPSQQWAFNAKNQIINASHGTKVLCVRDGELIFANPDSSCAAQKFEMFYPSDFVHIRNCSTGRFLTASANDTVAWEILNPNRDDDQQWGVTKDGWIINKRRGKVLQLTSSELNQSMQGAPLVLADQRPLGADNANQRFDFTSMDGAIRSRANKAFVIGDSDSKAVAVAYTMQDQTQGIEFISPFQYFSAQNQAISNDSKYWLSRSGNNVRLAASNSGGPEKMFTMTRYGEIISPIDGCIVQSWSNNAPPKFIDPASEPIGSNKSTFVYQSDSKARFKDTGAICLRDDTLALIEIGGRQPQVIMHAIMSYPASGNQAWSLVGACGSLFNTNREIAHAYFSDPVSLPSETSTEKAMVVTELIADEEVSKMTRIIIAIVTGLLELVDINVESVTLTAAKKIAQIVLGEASLAARIAIVMQGAITPASILAVADGITQAGLWLKLIKAVLPKSFWAWTITAAKMSLTTTGFSQGVSYALKGAELSLIVAKVAVIVETEEFGFFEPQMRRYG